MPKPRKKRSRRYNAYSEKTLQKALTDIQNGKISINKAAIKYNIAKGTLVNKVHGKHLKTIGAAPLFTPEEELTLVDYVITIKKWGYPFIMNDLKSLGKFYLDMIRKEPPKFGAENMPGREWASRFMKKHKEALNFEHNQNVGLTRRQKTASSLTKFFDHFRESLRDEDSEVPPSRIFNFSLANLSCYPFAVQSLYKQSKKYAPGIADSGASVMLCGSAMGEMLPPFVVYEAECLSESWTNGGPYNTKYSVSPSGCFDPGLFLEWFQTIFIPCVRNHQGKIVLLGDYASSLFSPMVLELARENNVVFACVPDGVSHSCQPFEFSFYAKLKQQWQLLLKEWREANGPEPIDRSLFPGLLNQLLLVVCIGSSMGELYSEDLVEGFRVYGIVPFQSENMSHNVMNRLPESIKKRTEDSDQGNASQEMDCSFKEIIGTVNRAASASLLQRKAKYTNRKNKEILMKKEDQRVSYEPIIVHLHT